MPTTCQRAPWGCVQHVGTKKYRLRYWGTDSNGTYRRLSQTVYGTRREAFTQLALAKVQHAQDAPCPTVKQAHDLWWVPWANRRLEAGQLSPSSKRQFDSAWKSHIEPRWGSVPLSAVHPRDLQAWFLTLTRSQAMHCRTVLSRIFQLACFEEVVDSNPMIEHYDLPQPVLRSSSTDRYSIDELHTVWSAVKGTIEELPFLLCAFGSCRVGESIAVRCDEVRAFEYKGIKLVAMPIQRQSTPVDGVREVLKNQFSYRAVAIPGPMGERILRIAQDRERTGHTWLVGEDLTPPPTKVITHAYRRDVTAAGLRYLPMQTLRASWETIARYTLNIEPAIIERLMGHSVGGVTGKHYDRPLESDLINVVATAYAAHPYADSWSY